MTRPNPYTRQRQCEFVLEPRNQATDKMHTVALYIRAGDPAKARDIYIAALELLREAQTRAAFIMATSPQWFGIADRRKTRAWAAQAKRANRWLVAATYPPIFERPGRRSRLCRHADLAWDHLANLTPVPYTTNPD